MVKATRTVLRRGGASNRPDLFDLIKDNKSLDFLPNYVTLKNGTQIDKAEYVDMAIRVEAYIKANGRLPAIVYRKSTLPDYNDSTMKLFVKTFNFKGNTIDEALAIVSKKKLYSKYFDSQKTDKKTITDASQGMFQLCGLGTGIFIVLQKV